MEFVTVFTGLNPAQAQLVRSRLEAADFLVHVKNETAALSLDGYALTAGGIQVQVPNDQVEDARALLAADEATKLP